jgi:hypothetical protein
MATQRGQIDDGIWYIHKFWNGYKHDGYLEYERKLLNGTTIKVRETDSGVSYFLSRINFYLIMAPVHDLSIIPNNAPDYRYCDACNSL